MDLVEQGTTATEVGTRPHFLPALAIVAAIVVSGGILATLSIAASNPGSGVAGARLTGDTSTEQVEALRGGAFQPARFLDNSYERVEALRGAALLPAGSVDNSYDHVEHIRAIGPGD